MKLQLIAKHGEIPRWVHLACANKSMEHLNALSGVQESLSRGRAVATAESWRLASSRPLLRLHCCGTTLLWKIFLRLQFRAMQLSFIRLLCLRKESRTLLNSLMMLQSTPLASTRMRKTTMRRKVSRKTKRNVNIVERLSH